jgi:phosphate/sulfate permease
MNEHTKNLIVGSISLVPIVGGAISLLIDKYVPSTIAQRRDALLQQFDKDIEIIKTQIQPQRLESEEYLTVLFKIFKNALEEHNQEKIQRFRGILQNSAICENLDHPEIELYIMLASDLTVSHMQILRWIQSEEFHEKVNYIHVAEDNDYSLQRFCVSDLEGKQLIFKNILNPYALTGLGERFLKFITLHEGAL